MNKQHSQLSENNSELNTSNCIVQRAKRMSIDEIDKKDNRSQSIENILSSSIARAKEKIQMMEQKKNIKDYRDSVVNNNSSRSLDKKQNNRPVSNIGIIGDNKDKPTIWSSPPLPQQQLSTHSNNQQYAEQNSSLSHKKPSTFQINIQQNQQQIQTTRSRQPTNKMDSNNNSAVVNVVKSLQLKISELERLNQSIERQKLIMTKQLTNVTEEKKLLLENMEEVKKKNIHLQHTTIKSLKQQIKQLQTKIQSLQTQNMQLKNNTKQLQLKLKQQHQNHLSIQKSNEKKMKQKKQQHINQQKHEMIYLSKIKQTELYEKNLHIKEKQLNEKEKKIELKWQQIFEKEKEIIEKQKVIEEKQHKNYEELVRHNQTMTLANQVRKQLEDKNNELKKYLQEEKKSHDQTKIKLKLIQQQLEDQIQLKTQGQNNITDMYTTKIEQLEEEIQQLKDTYKHNSKSKLSLITKNDKIDALKDQIVDITEQYDQLLARYKKAEEKFEKQQKQAKNYRSKFWKLKQIIGQISQKVSKMPNAIHSQLKLLIVKANKLQSYQIQKSSLSHIYGTPSKKSRSNSTQKSLSKLSKERSKSKEKSTSKNKTMNLPQLDSSRKSNHSVKSKRSEKSDRSLSKKKQVIMSTANKFKSTETDQKINDLEKQIQQLKSTYKKLVEVMNEKNDEETRNELNSLVFELQQKSQELTRLKKQKKAKKL